MHGSPGGPAQTRQLLEAVARGGGADSVVRGGRGRQAEDGGDSVSARLGGSWLSVGDVVLMDSSRAPMPHPPQIASSRCACACAVHADTHSLRSVPGAGPTCTIGRLDPDLPSNVTIQPQRRLHPSVLRCMHAHRLQDRSLVRQLLHNMNLQHDHLLPEPRVLTSKTHRPGENARRPPASTAQFYNNLCFFLTDDS